MVVRAAEEEGVWDSPPSGLRAAIRGFRAAALTPPRGLGAAHGLFAGYAGPWTWFAPASRSQCAFFIWKLMPAL